MTSLSLIDCCKNVFMDDGEKFNETSLHEKEDFNSNLNMEDITVVNYTHTKKCLQRF